MVKIYCLTLPEEDSFKQDLEVLKKLLPVAVFEAASKFRFIQGVQRKMLGDALMRIAVWQNFGVNPGDLKIAFGNAGKPFFQSHPTIHFNISHSGRWVVVAVSGSRVGVDVERVKKVNLGIAERFYSEREKARLFALPAADQTEYFFDLWTLKESFLKAIGTGLTKSLKSFTIEISDDRILLLDNTEKTDLLMKQLKIESGYKLAVCSDRELIDEKLHIVQVQELIAILQGI
jgi:4'-phosphopantetheinyl transferase